METTLTNTMGEKLRFTLTKMGHIKVACFTKRDMVEVQMNIHDVMSAMIAFDSKINRDSPTN